MKKTLLAMIVWVGVASFGVAGDIVALCIGNDAYVRDEDRLDTPVADATLMAETLRAIPGVRGDDVVLLKDGTRESIDRTLRQFREKARGAKLAIVFYSGHGMEDRPTGFDRAETFLLPVDAEIGNADDLPARAVGLGDIMATFRGLPPGGRVVILDCCRTGAPSATKALAAAGKNVREDLDARVARALGEAELAEGTLVSFSAGPGRAAAAFLKDTDAYSPFTHFLAQGIRERGGDLFTLVSQATATTRQATADRQVPRMRFDGDPSLIMAVRLPGGGEGGDLPPVSAGNRKEMDGSSSTSSIYAEKVNFVSRQHQSYLLKFVAQTDPDRFQIIRLPSPAWPQRETFEMAKGQVSGDEQFRVESFEEKIVANGIGNQVDASVLKITCLPKNEVVQLVRGIETDIPTYYAELKFELDPNFHEFVKEGEAFSLSIDPKTNYRVVKVNEASVIIAYRNGSKSELTMEIPKK